MRMYKPAFGEDVDLEDPSIFFYLPDNKNELEKIMFKEIGYAICYMDYWHLDVFPKEKQPENFIKMSDGFPHLEGTKMGDALIDINNVGYYQRQRVNSLIENFTKNRRSNTDNIMWLKEQIYLFQDEIENMC